MSTALSDPVERDPVTHQGITSVQFRIPHKRSADGTQAVIDRALVRVTYQVTTWDAVGRELGIATRSVIFADWPTAFKTDVRGVYAKLEVDAKAAGLIGPGTDEVL